MLGVSQSMFDLGLMSRVWTLRLGVSSMGLGLKHLKGFFLGYKLRTLIMLLLAF